MAEDSADIALVVVVGGGNSGGGGRDGKAEKEATGTVVEGEEGLFGRVGGDAWCSCGSILWVKRGGGVGSLSSSSSSDRFVIEGSKRG